MRSLFVRNFSAVGLLLLCLGLVWFIRYDEKRLKLDQNVSNRYRFHAIPVALSHMYQGKGHDYTAWRALALRFQDMSSELPELIDEFSRPQADLDDEVYYWRADDRGLADYVVLAFTVFGPSVKSLSHLYYLILLVGLLLYFMGNWRDSAALLLMVLYLVGVFLLLRFFHVRESVSALHGDIWKEPIGLFDSRVFDVLSFPAFLHLALVCWKRGKLSGIEIASSFGQGVILLFLFHARSSLGWQYLALGCLAVLSLARFAWHAYMGGEKKACQRPARAALVLVVLTVSVLSLREYKQRAYPEEYLAESGDRTFWHNALMGFAYHPVLREKYGFQVDDARIADLALHWLKERKDPRLKPGWNTTAILNSLGGHGTFDWPTYELVCREIYQDIWRRQPARAFLSYAFYKPYDIVRQSGKGIIVNFRNSGFVWLLAIAAFVGTGSLLASASPGARIHFQTHLKGVCLLLPFALIPSVAFYVSFTTFGCVCILGLMVSTLLIGQGFGVVWRRARSVLPDNSSLSHAADGAPQAATPSEKTAA